MQSIHKNELAEKRITKETNTQKDYLSTYLICVKMQLFTLITMSLPLLASQVIAMPAPDAGPIDPRANAKLNQYFGPKW